MERSERAGRGVVGERRAGGLAFPSAAGPGGYAGTHNVLLLARDGDSAAVVHAALAHVHAEVVAVLEEGGLELALEETDLARRNVLGLFFGRGEGEGGREGVRERG